MILPKGTKGKWYGFLQVQRMKEIGSRNDGDQDRKGETEVCIIDYQIQKQEQRIITTRDQINYSADKAIPQNPSVCLFKLLAFSGNMIL